MAKAKKPIEEVKQKVVEQKVSSRTAIGRAIALQAYLLSAVVAFAVLAILIKQSPNYFPIDLAITTSVQQITSPIFSSVMSFVSFWGYSPYQPILIVIIASFLFILRMRLEAVTIVSSTLVLSGIGAVIKSFVDRPRPSIDLIHVINHASDPSFPSGHVLSYTIFFGFLLFILWTSFKKSFLRDVAIIICFLMIGLVGLSRIYLGDHWASDVVGAYLLGSIWLYGTIFVYRRVKARRNA